MPTESAKAGTTVQNIVQVKKETATSYVKTFSVMFSENSSHETNYQQYYF